MLFTLNIKRKKDEKNKQRKIMKETYHFYFCIAYFWL